MPASRATRRHAAPTRARPRCRRASSGLGDRQAHRAARRDQELQLDAAQLGDLARRCSAPRPPITRSAGRKMIVPEAVVRLQLRQRHAFGGELLEQRQALGARARPRARRAGPRRRSRSARRSTCQRTPPSGAQAGRRPAPGAESLTVIVLGIDPGLANTGYGVVARRGGRLLALDGGVIETRAGLAAGAAPGRHPRARSTRCWTSTSRDAMALEELYFGQNVRTAFAVGQARGVVMLAAGQRGVPCTGYTPQQVKGAVCGNGRADKDQVARMVAGAARPAEAAAPRPRRRRAGGGDLPRQLRAAVAARSRERGRDDRAAAGRGRGAPHRPRRDPLRRRRLPRGGLGGDAAPRARRSASR